MSVLADKYRELRAKPWRLGAQSAFASAKYQVERAVRRRLLGLPRIEPEAGTIEINGVSVEIKFHNDSDCDHYLDDYETFNSDDEQPQSRRGEFSFSGKTYFRLTQYSEAHAYAGSLDAKRGKAEARCIAIEDRRAQVKRVQAYANGNVSYIGIEVLCEDIDPDCSDTLWGVDSDDTEYIREHIEDRVESILRSINQSRMAR